MAFTTDKNGNITLVQGDSGRITVSGIKTDKNYTVYFGIKDKKRKTVGSELSVNSNGMSSVIFELTGDYTDLLTVPKNKHFETYFYGIKVCDSVSGFEDTLVFGECGFLNLNTITVFPKKVEGI
ncbi:hypothetical protein IKQ21_03825 [bacterium]|nr:hypothetical protein [bacterium]